jgi:hypothetical protein
MQPGEEQARGEQVQGVSGGAEPLKAGEDKEGRVENLKKTSWLKPAGCRMF